MKYFAALIAGCFACAAQDSTSIALSNGVQIQVSADFGHPTGEEALTVEMARASGDSFYRIFRDQNHLVVFAYELVVNLGAGGDSLLVTARSAGDDFARRYPNADSGKPSPTLSAPRELGPLTTGRSATLQLFEVPGMGLSVSETIRVKMNQDVRTSGAFHFSGVQVFVEKNLVSGAPPASAVAGRFAMFYIPGRGGYFFSTQPVADRPFINAGTIDGDHMDFSIDNEMFHVTADAPIAGGRESSGLWVYHDPSYKPDGKWTLDLRGAVTAQSAGDVFFNAASDTLAWWLR